MTDKLLTAAIIYLALINIISWIVVIHDKNISRFPRGSVRRIPEKRFIQLSLLGGCFGTLHAMFIVRHKTKKHTGLVLSIIAITILWSLLICIGLSKFNDLQ